MVLSLGVGVVAGLATRSRWAMLLAPVVFAAAFELTRLGSDGPTVDAIHPGSTYGLIALFVGRGFHGALDLAPMVLAAAFGAAFARRLNGDVRSQQPPGESRALRTTNRRRVGERRPGSPRRRHRPPGGIDPIRGADGDKLAGSVAELTRVDIGGHGLAMMIRGASTDNPVLLYLAGTDIGATHKYLQSLEQDFVVVTWDQRGAGKAYTELEPSSV